ncbi:MAG: hypothetical protein MR292_09705 [Alistipes sp.]|nr:hypothetical protein [Alistipes sp.]
MKKIILLFLGLTICFSTVAQQWIGKFQLAETNQYYEFSNATFYIGDQKFKVDLSLIFCTHGGYNAAAIVIKRSSFEPLCLYIIPQKTIITNWSLVNGGDPLGECVAISAIGLTEDTNYRIRFCFDDKVSTTPSFLLIEWEDKVLFASFNSGGGVRNLLPNTYEWTRLTFMQNLLDKLKLKYNK